MARYPPGRPVWLLSGVDERGWRWLRLVIPLGPLGRAWVACPGATSSSGVRRPSAW